MIQTRFQKVMTLLAIILVSAASAVQAQTDVTGYETVTVTIPASAYDASQGAPQMAPVKYNKTFPLVLTSDDMGKTELTNNWAALNGYPIVNDHVDLGIQPVGTKFLQSPYKKYYTQGESQDVADHAPMTYTDNVGKTQRYRMTCAVMPYDINSNNYAKINANDAKLMLRTGFSYAQHDVDDISSVQNISTAMTANSTIWATQVGIGLKVMVEPNGNHNYLAAGKLNSGVCWNIFQNPTSEYPANSKTLTSWANRTDWSENGIGTMPSTFSNKPTGGFTRTFFQGNESAWKSAVDAADGTSMIIGGTHGIGDEIKDHLRNSTNIKNNAWVCGADEVWEYYHIYNNLKIESVSWDDTNKQLTFDVQVPTYQKNQFRELTLNIPGLTGTGAPTFSTASGKTVPVTGGYNTDGGSGIGYTMNIGLENSINTHISELMTIYRDDQTNAFVKRDLEYLISQLWDGTTYTTQLNANPTYDLTVQSSLGTTLATFKTDTNGEKSFAVPRYIIDSNKLYEHTANASKPYYVNTITTSAGTPSAVAYAEKGITGNAVLLVEGEDMEGATVVGADFDLNDNSSRYHAMQMASMGMGGCIVSSTPATVTNSLPRGKYKAVICYGDTYKGQGTYTYNLNVDGTSVYSFNNSSVTDKTQKEFTTEEFSIEATNTPITISTNYTTDHPEKGGRWIDYVYFIQTGTLDPVAPAATITASAGVSASVKTGTSITITATATQNGGSNFTGTKIYQCSDAAGTIDGDAKATSATETATYTFTPSAGTYYFKATADDGTLGTGTSSIITVTVVANIDTYTLNIIDKSGNVAMTTTVASGSMTADPLPNTFRSPFAQNYKYYNTQAEAQANSGNNLTALADFAQATVYVGYDVKSEEFNANKKFAIYNINNKYMHATLRLSQSHVYNNLWWLQEQNYDASGGTSGISATTLAFVDNSYMWNLGDDPYNVKIQGLGSKRYVNQETYNTTTYGRMEHLVTSPDNATKFCIVYYGGNTTAGYYTLYNRTHDKYVYYNGDGAGGWRLDPQRDAGKLKIEPLPSLNINVVNASGNVECTLQGYFKNGAAMPAFTPFFLTRTYTSNQRYYYDAACTDAITADGTTAVNAEKIIASNYNIYLKYDLDSSWNTDNLFKVSNNNTQYWYALRFCNTNNYLNAGTTGEHNIGSAGSNASTSTTANNSHWALFGTPYALKLVNRDAANDGLLAGANMAITGSSAATAKMYAESNDVSTIWEMRNINNTNVNASYRSNPALNPLGSFGGEAPFYFLYANSSSLNPTDNQNCRILQYDYKGMSAVAATLTLSAPSNAAYVDKSITLTATATPAENQSITYYAIEQEISSGNWQVVGTAYEGSDVAGVAEKNGDGVVTLTHNFIPNAEGIFNFRAKAEVNNNTETPLYTTDATQVGSALSITASIEQLQPSQSTYTLKLIDKEGNELFSEDNVPASRIIETNSVSKRNGDPLNNDYRSPLVSLYKYYEGTEAGKTSAQAADDNNQVDWNTYDGTTVYVGYEVSDDIDLNYSSDGSDGFNSLSSLMNNRKERNATNNDNTKVRDASKFGKMYLLKFKTSQDYYLENTKDSVSKTKTDAGSYVYPYTNGDGPIYLYNDDIYQDTKDNGASTRTRYPWFLVSPNGDPYHVYITSWQSSHDDKSASDKTNYYSFLRTYYVDSTIGVVTNNVTDDPNTKDGNNVQILPTDYMILRGNGTDGQYKLMTAGLVNGSRQTVTSIEQYWRNNPTAQYAADQEKNSGTITDETKLTNRGWHKYSSYVNAANWTGSKYTINGKEYGKNYLNEDHWYMSVSVGDGSFDLVETNIDGVLVLLDNHGWEIMRKPIVEHSDPDYNSVKAELRKYDSPMVKNYKFYSTRNVDHKVPGYHKYDITYQTSDKTKITGLTLINTAETITSLADYPEKMSSGALTDLYVTYEVKDEYANSYTGAATEGETAASSFLLRQGSNYAKADGTSITSTATVSEADRWKIKPNFNIDAEMGYLYTGGTDGEKSKSELETLYNTSKTNDFIPNGFDPYNLQIQNTTTSTYFTTNATTAALNAGTWDGNGSTLSLAAVSSHITPTGYDNKTLAVTNSTFMAVKDQYGNMRLMPRFDHSQVVDNFATLADPATLSAYDATNSQTTQVATPVTYHIIDNSGNDALQMTVTDGVGLKVPDALKSPMVSAYQFHSTLAHASGAETRGTGDLSVAQENVYVSYTVDATKMAATKKYAISSGTSNVFLHLVFRGNQSSSSYNNFEYRYRIDQQTYDQESNNSPTPAANQFNHSNLPFVDKTYLWTLGDDPYNITIASEAARNWRYLARNPSSSPTGVVLTKRNVSEASKYCLLYWNGDPTSEYSVLRYAGLNTEAYMQYNSSNDGRWVDATTNSEENAKLLIEELPEINVNVVNAAGMVEYTLAGRYINTASVPASNKVPFFLQRSYTSGQTYYYTMADAAVKENAITAGTVPVAATMTDNMTDGKYNIYVRYDLDQTWNGIASTVESPRYFLLNYPGNSTTTYLGINNETYKELTGKTISTEETSHWALYGTPYNLRIENRQYTGYYIGIPENAASNFKTKIYNSFDGIISTWELAAYTNSNIEAAYRQLPMIRPQGAISREAPLYYVRPNGSSAALADTDNKTNRVTFESAAKVTLSIVDKSGREVISEPVSTATIENTSGDPLSAGLRSPYAKNYKYYATLAEAQANSGTVLDQTALLGKTEQTVYVGYDAITSDNVAEGETILKMNGSAAYRVRRNASNSQAMHAVFSPSNTGSSDNNYGWKMDYQTLDCYGGETVNYNTLPFIDRAWAWEFVSENNDPYSVKIRNKATGQYLGCENNSTKQYQTTFATNDANATVYSLLRYGSNTQYLAIYVTDATTSQTGYLTYTGNDGGTWRLRSDRNDAATYIRVEELVEPLDIHIVGPAGTSHAGEVEATIHGYRNSSVGANTVPAFVPYFLSRAYTSGQKFYYTKEGAVAAAENTEISTVSNDNLTDSYGSDGVIDVFVSYTLDNSNWIPSGTSLTDAAKTANTTIIKPFYSGEGKINWYGVRASANDADFLKAGTDIPAVVTRTTLDTDNADDVEMTKSEWAFIGTPYSLQLVERYHGMSSHLGVADNAATNDRAYVYANGAEGSVTTFELLTGLGNTQSKLFLRPQGSLNAQAPYLYLGGNDVNMPLSKQASSTQGLDLTWVKETDAKTLTFTLYDPQGNSMSSDISDYTFTGVSEGDNLAELFAVTGMKRRYCDYTYYSDNTLTTEVTTASSDANETVYVKWEYADDAPVFSTGSEPRDYQYYMMNASNGSASYVMKVKGNSTDGYTLAPNDGLTPVKEGHHQFALVGTPYAFKLYSRYAGMNVKTDNTGSNLVFSGDATTEAVFNLPIPVNSAITQSTQMDLRMKNNPNKHIWCDANSIWMNNSTGGYLLLTYLIAPVRVFKEGSTAIANMVDHQEYALPLNPNGTARATTERITDSDLYRRGDTGNPNYYTNDFRHAFCNYTFYHTYDWSTGALSNAIPSTGNFAGLPYYGGKNDQIARSFFATYTVDDEQFSKIYVLDNANAQTLKFFGCGTKTTANEKDYFPIVTGKTTLADARADDTNAYRWYMTGDPYNLQLTCLGTGDDYQSIPLGVQNVHTTLSDAATVENGMLARLTNDATYAVKSHWEVVQNTDGNHIFYLVDDVTTYDDTDRYTYSLGQRVYTSPDLYASSNQIYALRLTPAIAQYNVVWTIMEGSSGNYTNVATYTKANVSKGTTFTLDDIPEVLKRHFCEYNSMYSDVTCATAYTNNEATVGDAELNIYVPYTLKAGAPTFYESVEAYTSTAGESQDPYLIRLNRTNYVKETGNNDADITTVKDDASANSVGKWVLIGSPYKVQFYNVAASNYLYINMGSIAPNTSVPVGAADAGNSYWTLLDDKTGNRTAICMWESDNHQMLYLGYNGTDVVMNILSDKAQATSAEFVGSNGIDGIKMRLQYGANTLRKNGSGSSMASQTETFTIYDYFNKGTKLIDVMPSLMKRAFCSYTFKYNDTDVTEDDVRDIITSALVIAAKDNTKIDNEGHITVDVTYTVNSPFTWSGATTGTNGYADKHWYYLVNNHIQSTEKGKMVYRDANPKLRVSTGLLDNRMYLNNFEWCVIGDPYGFKMLNHYDPDQRFDQYISVTNDIDSDTGKPMLEQVAGNDNCLFEMMPGQYSYNFWIHPVYSVSTIDEPTDGIDELSYVGNNSNGSAAILLTSASKALRTNASANFRLEMRTDATLQEYLKYAGFVGALKYDVATATDIAAIKTKLENGTATDEEKETIHNLINNPENTVNMVQGYYRLIPYTWEYNQSERRYVRGYLRDTERTASSGDNQNLKVETQALAEYDPASIFWFESTTSDGTENGYPRYYVKTQGLNLTGNGLSTGDGFKCSYEGMGAAIMQLKSNSSSSHEYLSCAGGDETSTNQCFDEQAGLYKTRFYLQPVGSSDENLLDFKLKMNAAFGKSYASIYVPFDVQIPDDSDAKPFYGVVKHDHSGATNPKDKYTLYCLTLDYIDESYGEKIIPACTPVIIKSESADAEIAFTLLNDAPHPNAKLRGDLEENEERVNKIEGIFLSKVDTRPQLYTFGREKVYEGYTGTVYDNSYTGRVGFFKRSNVNKALNANRVFYISPFYEQDAGSRGMAFAFDLIPDEEVPTGEMTPVFLPKDDGETIYYDLQGRKVTHPSRPGVYIVNGKKIVLK